MACDYLINAAGIWSSQVAELVGINIPLKPDKGSMIVLGRVYTQATLHRIRARPGSGDVLNQANGQSILGTTSERTDDIDTHAVTEEEITELLREGREMVPSMDRSHLVQAYAGVRPLYTPDTDTNSRAVSRAFRIINHRQDGLDNFISVVGGKFVIHRLMAEKAVDQMCQSLGVDAICSTASIKLG